jgi:hypothetical protein
MKQNYAETDFERAAAIVADAASPVELVQRLGIDWEFLTWLGLGVAAEVAPEGAEASGAEAFSAGFLIGAYLRRGGFTLVADREDTKLPWAVDVVRRRGRHAIIADYCDLGTIARIESAYAEVLVDEYGREARAAITRLFESGLATGLVLDDVG